MKKILASLLSLIMIVGIATAFVGCDVYTGTTFNMSTFGLYNADGTEYTFKDYKDYFGIKNSDIKIIYEEYGVEIVDVASLKAYVMKRNTYSLQFKKESVVVFTNTVCEDSNLGIYKENVWQGAYSYDNQTLAMTYPMYRTNSKGAVVQTVSDTNVIDQVSSIDDLYFAGDSTIVMGEAFTVATPDDTTITMSFPQSTSENSDLMILTFVAVK